MKRRRMMSGEVSEFLKPHFFCWKVGDQLFFNRIKKNSPIVLRN
jgi:hypothetical protein